MWWRVALGVAGGLLLAWAILVVALWRARSGELRLQRLLRLLPDVVMLVTGLARDPTVPRGVRLRLWLLVGYLAMPFDLVPDFLPVIGHADDAIVVVWVLRSVARRAGREALAHNWRGTPEGLATVERLSGLAPL
jgi:uncharacterized membrane protein YkvA (DUF1232 family)